MKLLLQQLIIPLRVSDIQTQILVANFFSFTGFASNFQTTLSTYWSLLCSVNLPGYWKTPTKSIYCTQTDTSHESLLIKTVSVLNGQKLEYFFNGKKVYCDIPQVFHSLEELSETIDLFRKKFSMRGYWGTFVKGKYFSKAVRIFWRKWLITPQQSRYTYL